MAPIKTLLSSLRDLIARDKLDEALQQLRTLLEQSNLEKALSYYEQCNQLEKELYEAYPQNVSFKNGLAISYSQLGRFYRDQKTDRTKQGSISSNVIPFGKNYRRRIRHMSSSKITSIGLIMHWKV